MRVNNASSAQTQGQLFAAANADTTSFRVSNISHALLSLVSVRSFDLVCWHLSML